MNWLDRIDIELDCAEVEERQTSITVPMLYVSYHLMLRFAGCVAFWKWCVTLLFVIMLVNMQFFSLFPLGIAFNLSLFCVISFPRDLACAATA